jgi:predicted transcriptional regulator
MLTMVNAETYLNTKNGAVEQASLAETAKKLEQRCQNCKPLSMLECVADCKVWKLKNEFRQLHKIMQDPSFTNHLLNTMKNKRRMQILKTLIRGEYAISELQQELKKLGYCHSQETIIGEYVNPLIEVGLVVEKQQKYHSTMFARKINDIFKDHYEVFEELPSHSECYEEKMLTILFNGPKTYKQVEKLVPAKSIARILKRLKTAEMIETIREKDFVFFFKTRRDPGKESLSHTEKRVRENLSEEGISAKKLAAKTGISLRRTYKYLRRLKGKKLVFVRKEPRVYVLTEKGLQTVTRLQRLSDLVQETTATLSQLFQNQDTARHDREKDEKQLKTITPLTVSQYPKSK